MTSIEHSPGRDVAQEAQMTRMSRWKLVRALAIAIMPGWLKPFLYRVLTGAKIGRSVRIGFGTLLLAERVEIGDHTRIGALTFIRATEFVAGKYVSIGSLSKIGAYRIELRSRAIVGSRADIAGDYFDARSVLLVGMHSWIFERCYVNVARSVTLGRNVGVGGSTLIFTHGYWLSQLDGFPVKYAPVTIGDDVWLPWDCFIMPGVRIGNRVVVGAKSLVTKDVPDGALVGGIPAKVLKDISYREVPFEEKKKLLLEVSEALAARRAQELGSREDGGRTVHLLAGRPLVVVHSSEAPEGSDLVPGALNIVRSPLDLARAREHACLSLVDYASSSYDLFDEDTREWLAFARGIGMRFYPWDEK
jgi:acetyltransferase-like isoleucine patch superfamily enzyme